MVQKKQYIQVSAEQYNVLMSRYDKFVNSLDDPAKDIVNVFDPLSQKLLNELELIREVSKDLQKKKDEDINKAAQAAKQEAEEAAKREAEDKTKAVEESEKKDE